MLDMNLLIKSSKPVKSRPDSLPNEIREEIMRRSIGVTALHALIEADFQAKAVFERYPHAILLSAIRCSTMERELQKMLCTIISIREGRKYHARNEAFQTYTKTFLQGRSTALDLDLILTASSKPLNTLREAVDICNDITDAETSFVKVRLPKTATRIQSSIVATDSIE